VAIGTKINKTIAEKAFRYKGFIEKYIIGNVYV